MLLAQCQPFSRSEFSQYYMERALWPHSPQNQPCPGLHQQQHNQQALVRPSLGTAFLLGPQHRDVELLGWVQRRSRGCSETGAALLWGEAEGVGVAQPGEKAVGRPNPNHSVILWSRPNRWYNLGHLCSASLQSTFILVRNTKKTLILPTAFRHPSYPHQTEHPQHNLLRKTQSGFWSFALFWWKLISQKKF